MRSELNYDRSNIRTKVKSIIGRNFSGIDTVINEPKVSKEDEDSNESSARRYFKKPKNESESHLVNFDDDKSDNKLNGGKFSKTRQNKKHVHKKKHKKNRKQINKINNDTIDVILDNQMRIAQALTLKIPAIIRCCQPLPNHRWPGGMHVDRPDSRDMGLNEFTWYDGFNIYATESDATQKTFSDAKLIKSQVENVEYSENPDEDTEEDSKTFVNKCAWP